MDAFPVKHDEFKSVFHISLVLLKVQRGLKLVKLLGSSVLSSKSLLAQRVLKYYCGVLGNLGANERSVEVWLKLPVKVRPKSFLVQLNKRIKLILWHLGL